MSFVAQKQAMDNKENILDIRVLMKIVPDKAMTTSEAWELDKAVRIKHWAISFHFREVLRCARQISAAV